MKIKLSSPLIFLACGLFIVSAGFCWAAWNEPTDGPPNQGTAGAPLTTGSGSETKSGGLTVTGGVTSSKFCFASGCVTSWAGVGGGGGAWSTSTSGIYYSDGNVGIGTSSPAGTLHVANSTGEASIGLQGNGQEYPWLVYNDIETMDLVVKNSDPLGFGLFEFADGGRLGINRREPFYQLTNSFSYRIFDPNDLDNFLDSVQGIHITGSRSRVTVQGATDAGIDLISTAATPNNQWMQIVTASDGITKFIPMADTGYSVSNSNIISIKHSNGNLGVGTSSASTKLEVFGTVSSTGARVNGTSTITSSLIAGATTYGSGNLYVGNTISTGTSSKAYIEYQSGYGLRINKTGAGNDPVIYASNGAYLSAVGAWSSAPSSKKLKENFQEVDSGQILDKINSLDLVKYNYILESDDLKHFGAMAEDWYSVFGLGDNHSISGNDAAMVALKGIQQLSKEVTDLRTKLASVNVSEVAGKLAKVKEPNVKFNVADNVKVTNYVSVQGGSSFYGTINAAGGANFFSRVAFKEHTYFDQDSAGTVIIPAGATLAEFKFDKPYGQAPIITLTPRSNLEGHNYWVSRQSVDGFTIKVNSAMNTDIQFNWHATAIVSD